MTRNTQCLCPRDGAYLCSSCTALLHRVVGSEGATPSLKSTATAEPEARFLARVLALAKAQGWIYYHPYRSDKSIPGWPDLVLAKPGKPLLLIELKTDTGKPTMDQLRWLSVLQQTEKPQAAMWRPRDWAVIMEILGDTAS